MKPAPAPGSASAPRRVAILISGRGSNMRALLDDSRAADAPYVVSLVVSDRTEAPGLAIARNYGVETQVVPVDGGIDARVGRAAYDRSLAAVIDAAAPALILLAGFMRILSPEFVARYAGRILNIHPSLLPSYPGLHTHRKVLAAGDAVHGATVHFVTAELDGGPRIVQGCVPVAADDDEASLAERVLSIEHRIYPLAVRWFCEGRLRCCAQTAWLDGKPLTAPVTPVMPVTDGAGC